MYELFEHTADLGIRATARTWPELLSQAALGLTACLVEAPDTIRPTETHLVAIPGTDREYLLFDFLRELLYRFEVSGFLCSATTVTVTDEGLNAIIHGEPADPTRHPMSHEVKAITYHGLVVEESANGFLAEVIVDI